MRDKFVYRICNFLVNNVATERYRVMLSLVIKLGIEELERRLNDA